MKRIGIYLRVSTEEQARLQDGSLVSQKARILEYVENQNKARGNWGHVVDLYCDEGKSAKSISGRPEFRRLLTDIQSGQVNLIISTELSRMSRSIRDFCEIWDLLKKHNASFVTLRECFDTTTASGEMMVFNLMNFAQYERKQTGERIALNWQSRAKRGLFNGGTIPLGYNRNPDKKGELVIHLEEAKIVEMIFHLFLERESIRNTCLALAEMGISQKRFTNKHGFERGGKPFSIDGINGLLTNATYIGKRWAEVNGERTLVRAIWRPIIDETLFEQVQARLARNKNRYKPASWKTYAFPLTELITCGECGKHMGGKSGTGRKQKHHYYGHAQLKDVTKTVSQLPCQVKNVRAPRLEDLVLKCLKSVMADPSLIEKWVTIYRAESLANVPEVVAKGKRIESELNSISRKLANLVQRIGELPSEVPADLFYDQIRDLTAKKSKLTLAREKLRTKSHQIEATEIDEAGLFQKIVTATQKLESLPKEKQRAVFKTLIHNVEIHPMKLRIGMYAPSGRRLQMPGPEKQKATGTDGLSFQTQSSLPNLLSFDPSRRAGSSTVGLGARRGT